MRDKRDRSSRNGNRNGSSNGNNNNIGNNGNGNQSSPSIPAVPPAARLQEYSFTPADFISPIRQFNADSEAQEIVYDAWGASNPQEKLRLARKALAKFPYCVDAYNVLASLCKNDFQDLEKSREAYENAVECGRIQWPGIEAEEELAWGNVEYRPFLRSIHGLGLVLQELGQTDKAIEQYRFLLTKNPGDNQGVRMTLFQALIEVGEYKEAEKMAEKHSNGRKSNELHFRFGFVLMDYLRNKLDDSLLSDDELAKTLVEAVQINQFVVPLLLEEIPLGPPPSYLSPGNVEQATDYVRSSKQCWERVAGALEWLRGMVFQSSEEEKRKPDDDGTILFDLLARGRLSLKLRNGQILVATTNVAKIPGRGLHDFALPPGMKTHDPEKIVCHVEHVHPTNAIIQERTYTTFSYHEVESIPFWHLFHDGSSLKEAFGAESDDRHCAVCYEPANFQCSACKVVWYCSQDCQRKDWKGDRDKAMRPPHKIMCKKFIKH